MRKQFFSGFFFLLGDCSSYAMDFIVFVPHFSGFSIFFIPKNSNFTFPIYEEILVIHFPYMKKQGIKFSDMKKY